MLPLKDIAWQHKMKLNRKRMLSSCPLEKKSVDFWGLSFHRGQFPGLAYPSWLQCQRWYRGGGRLCGRGWGMWGKGRLRWSHSTEEPDLRGGSHFSTAQQCLPQLPGNMHVSSADDLPPEDLQFLCRNSLNHSPKLLLHLSCAGSHTAKRPIFKAQHLFQRKAMVRYPCLLPHHLHLCVLQKKYLWRPGFVLKPHSWCGLGLVPCSPRGWHKPVLNSRAGYVPHRQVRMCTPLSWGVGWRPPCPWFALQLAGNCQLQLKLRD